MKAETRDTTISLLDHYLTYLACADRPLKKFDRSLLMTPEAGDLDSMTHEPIADLNATAAELDCSWTIRVLAKAVDTDRDGNPIKPSVFTLYENRTVPFGEVSKFKYRMPNCDPNFYEAYAKHTHCTVCTDGSVDEDFIYAAFRRRNITLFDPRRRVTDEGVYSREHNQTDRDTIQLMLGTAFMVQYHWLAHVAITDDAPRVTMPTDPTGVKELWKFRDVPEGKRRRDALLHWVSEHWRQNREDPDVENYVRSHLRGQRTLTASGFTVTVEESSADKAKIVEIRQSRTDMRVHRLDRRKKTIRSPRRRN